MSISTYTTLKQAVFDFSGRDDLSSKFASILQVAEDYIYNNDTQPLRTTELITTSTVTTVAGTNSLALPAGFMSALSVLINIGGGKKELTNTSPAALRQNGESGYPCKYAITSGLIFDYTPDGAYDIDLTYYAKPEPLDTINNTNDILTNYPTIYLFGCLSAIADMTGEMNDADMYYQKMIRAILGAMRSNRKKRHAPGATSTIRGATP